MLFSNYRPVSVLPVFSKIFERIMHNRLLKFINQHNILYDYQFGFRGDHSPNLALLFLVDKISNALENGEYVMGLFLDFSKAFDTVNHDILFTKLKFYGIRGTALDWFESYLSNRMQYVEYNGVQSSKQRISCGVPQGSILGPILFLLYINDLASVSEKLFAILFADDSNMFLTGKNPNDLVTIMNEEIKHVTDWLTVNKLSLNLKKTHYIIFHKQRAKFSISEELIIGGMKIEMKSCTKFLGVMIDKCLTFKDHINYIIGKISRGLGILYRCKRFFNHKTLLTLYNAFIYPYLTYCIPVWGNTCVTYLDPLVKAQKRAIRVIAGVKRYEHTDPLFRKMKILKTEQIYIYMVQLFMFKQHHTMLPSVFECFFDRNLDFHSYPTRIGNLFRPPPVKTDLLERFIRVMGVRSWKYFSNHLSVDCSLLS